MKRALLLIATVLAGCADKTQDVNVAIVEPSPIRLPAECTMKDQPFIDVPASDVTRSGAVNNYKANKDQYNRVLSRRSVCRAAIQAAQKG